MECLIKFVSKIKSNNKYPIIFHKRLYEKTIRSHIVRTTQHGKANLEVQCSIPGACQTVFFLLKKRILSSSLTNLENM